MIKAVLDTNTIVSALIAPDGCPHAVLAAFRERKFVLVVSPAIITEVTEVLERPFFRDKRGVTASDIARLKHLLLKRSQVVAPETCRTLVPDDPDDNQILACALEARAEFLVTGDHHLLHLRRFEDTRIVTPREFLAVLEKRRRQD